MLILETSNLTKDFMGLKALKSVDLSIHEGEIFGLIGPNGSGKTTCLNLIAGFLKPTSGSITYKGMPITNLEPYEVAKRGIIRTFQFATVFQSLTCEENLITAMHLKTKGNMWGAIIRSKAYRQDESRSRDKVREILRFLGMENRRDTVANNLPLGEQRKLAIAIALAGQPAVLLLDEPSAGMSPKDTTALIGVLLQIQQRGVTTLIVEHKMRVVMALCNRIAVLNYGVKIAEGSAEEVANDKHVISVYLGKEENGNERA